MTKTLPYTDELVAEMLVLSLKDHGIQPDETFTAAAGAEYGVVEAFEYRGGCALAYGDNGSTRYTLAENTADLHEWLESSDLDSVDTAIQTANVRGMDAVREAESDDPGPFAVLVVQSFYGPKVKADVLRDERYDVRYFDTYAEAQQHIEDLVEETYYLSHNEASRPDYKIVRA